MYLKARERDKTYENIDELRARHKREIEELQLRCKHPAMMWSGWVESYGWAPFHGPYRSVRVCHVCGKEVSERFSCSKCGRTFVTADRDGYGETPQQTKEDRDALDGFYKEHGGCVNLSEFPNGLPSFTPPVSRLCRLEDRYGKPERGLDPQGEYCEECFKGTPERPEWIDIPAAERCAECKGLTVIKVGKSRGHRTRQTKCPSCGGTGRKVI